MTSQYVSLEFHELSDDKKEELRDQVKIAELERAEELGKEALKQSWHIAPKTWKEAFCRDAGVDYKMWCDFDETSKEFQEHDWEDSFDSYLDDIVEEKLYSAFHHLEVEVEL